MPLFGYHDWLVGTRQMDKYLRKYPNFLLATNLVQKVTFRLSKNRPPQKTFEIDGVKVSILG